MTSSDWTELSARILAARDLLSDAAAAPVTAHEKTTQACGQLQEMIVEMQKLLDKSLPPPTNNTR